MGGGGEGGNRRARRAVPSSMAAAPLADAAPTGPSLFVPRDRLSTPRRLLASAGVATVLAVVLHAALTDGPLSRPGSGWSQVLVIGELAVFGLGLLLLHVDRVIPQLVVRAELWTALALSSLVALVERPVPWEVLVVLGGATVALLALGRTGLDSSAGTFAPKVLRAPLLTMMFVGLGAAHAMGLLVSAMFVHGQPALGVAAAVTPVLAVAGVVGLARTRAWGLFAYVGAILSAFATAGLVQAVDLEMGHYGDISAFLSVLWSFAGVVFLAIGLPVFSALVWRRSAGTQDGPWASRLHALGVIAVAAVPLLRDLA
jgi:hypothetical protein